MTYAEEIDAALDEEIASMTKRLRGLYAGGNSLRNVAVVPQLIMEEDEGQENTPAPIMTKDLVKLVKECRNRKALAQKAGLHINTINNWIYYDIQPTLDNAERVLNAMGYELKIEKIKEEEDERETV